jgi:hypothetical protein
MPEEKVDADPLTEAYRKEKRAFWRACSFVGGVVLSLLVREVGVFFDKRRLRRMILAGIPVGEIVDQMNEFRPWAYLTIGLLLPSLVGLVLSLGLWLRAIQERRRIEAKSTAILR